LYLVVLRRLVSSAICKLYVQILDPGSWLIPHQRYTEDTLGNTSILLSAAACTSSQLSWH